jgi:hypothetical protein
MKARLQIVTQDHYNPENEAVRSLIVTVIQDKLSGGYLCSYGMVYNQQEGLLSFVEHSSDLGSQLFAEVGVTTGHDTIVCKVVLPLSGITEQAKTDLLALYALTGSRCPFDMSNKALRVTGCSVRSLVSDSDRCLYTTPAKPIVAINRFLATREAPPLDTPTSNKLLADIKSLIAGATYTVEYIDQYTTISEVYNYEDKDRWFPSCMSGKPRCYFELYDNLQADNKLSMLRVWKHDHTGRTAVGRALVWIGAEGTLYLDRVYMYTLNSTPVNNAVKAMTTFLKENGIEKCVHEPTANAYGLLYKHVNLKVNAEALACDSLPYIDSLHYLDSSGVLRTRLPDTHCRILHAKLTDGSVPEYAIAVNGSLYAEDDCVEVDDDIAELPVPRHMVGRVDATDLEPARWVVKDNYRCYF